MTEDEPSDCPDALVHWLATFNAIPPMTMSPEEEADWLADRREQREFELERFDDRGNQQRRSLGGTPTHSGRLDPPHVAT